MAPFYFVTEDQKRQVLETMGQSFDSLKIDIQNLRDWIDVQPHLPKYKLSDSILGYFLLRNKFSVENTKTSIDMYFTIRTLVSEYFSKINPNLPERQEYYKNNIIVTLPKLTKDLSRVFFVSMAEQGAANGLFITQEAQNISELRIRSDFCLNEILVIDVKNCTIEDYLKATPKILRQSLAVYEKVHKMRLKAVYFINCKPHTSMFLALVKPFLRTKHFQRITCDTTSECLKTFLTEDELPKDYGGNGKSLKEIQDMLRSAFLTEKELFNEIDKLKVNEELRPEKLNNDDILGYYGNFKKLDVD